MFSMRQTTQPNVANTSGNNCIIILKSTKRTKFTNFVNTV